MTDDEQRRRDIESITAGRSVEPDPSPSLPRIDALPNTQDIRELCKATQKTVFEVYYELMTDDSVPPTVRLAAANAISNRGLGKPEQAVTQTVKIERPEVGIDEVARMMMFSMRDAKERGTLPASEIIDVTPEKEDTTPHEPEDKLS